MYFSLYVLDGEYCAPFTKACFCSIHTIWWRFFPPSLMVAVFVTLSNHLNFMWIWWFLILICQIVLFIIIHLFLPYYVYWLVWLWFWHFFKLIRYIDWLWLIIDFCHLIWLDWLWNCLRHFNKWQFSIHYNSYSVIYQPSSKAQHKETVT